MTSCPLCEAALDPKRAGTVLFEDERLFAVLHEDWVIAGHAMLVWKRHVENLSDLEPDDAAHLMAWLSRTELAILQATGAGRAILLKLGIQVPHLHLHVYPVPTHLDREAVMSIIAGNATGAWSAEQRAALAERIQGLL